MGQSQRNGKEGVAGGVFGARGRGRRALHTLARSIPKQIAWRRFASGGESEVALHMLGKRIEIEPRPAVHE